MQKYLALCLVMAGCGSTEMGLDGGIETSDAPRSNVDGGFLDASAFDGGDGLDAGPRPDAGPSGPDVPMPEDCENPGDEDGDRLSDCDDPDCWSGCAASHVGRVSPGLSECGPVVSHTVAESREVCMAYSGDPGDAPTRCVDDVPYTSTARFFCDDAGDTRALWLQEHLSFPPLMRGDSSPTSFELIDYEYTPARDAVRVSQASSSGGRDPQLSLQDGVPNVELITVYRLEPGDTSFERMVGATRLTETVAGEPPRVVATTRELFRTGGTRLRLP